MNYSLLIMAGGMGSRYGGLKQVDSFGPNNESILDYSIFDAIKVAMEVNERRNYKIPTKKLNDLILPIIEQKPPPSTKGKYVKIKFCRQLPTKYPQFAFYCNFKLFSFFNIIIPLIN